MMSRRDARKMRNGDWLAKACALVTLLTLVVTPACAPLCVARTCARVATSTAPEAPCHAAKAMRGNVPHVHAIQNCRAPELPAAMLSSSTKNDGRQENRRAGLNDAFAALSQELSVYRSGPSERCVEGPPLAHSSVASLSVDVLRI
jgi:hypothetical protein